MGQKKINGCQGLGVRGKGSQGKFEGDGSVLYLDCGDSIAVSQLTQLYNKSGTFFYI